MPFTTEMLKKDGQGMGIMLITIVITLFIMGSIVGDYTVLYRVMSTIGTILKNVVYVAAGIGGLTLIALSCSWLTRKLLSFWSK